MTGRAEQIAAVLAEHHLSAGGRNLGQYRTEWKCACGALLTTDGHKGETVKDVNDAHVAAALAAQERGRTCADCGHPWHSDTDCGEVVGYDHLNGDHECGCPGRRGGADATTAAVEAVAVAFCDSFTDWEHHDQTDDHPCSRCKRYAAALSEPVGALAKHDAEVLRAAAEMVADADEQGLGLGAAYRSILREADRIEGDAR